MSNINNKRNCRSLTPDLKHYARRRAKISFISMGLLFPALLVYGLFVITFDLIMAAALLFDSFKQIPAAFNISTILLNIPAPFIAAFLIKKKINLYQRYCFVLLNGTITEARIRSIDNEWNVQINDTPRTILDLEIKGRDVIIKTFAPEILNHCNGSVLTLLWHGDMPDIIIPVESLDQQSKKSEPEIYTV